MTHRGVDGKPVPSRFSDRAELEALLDVMAQQRRGVVAQQRRGVVAIAPGEQCSIDDMYELQPRTGVPFTYGALLTMPTGSHKRLIDLQPRGYGPRRAGLAAGHAVRWRSRW
jgi:hypothetical protein